MLRNDKFLWLIIAGLALAVVVLVSQHDEGMVGPMDTNAFASLVYFSALLLLVGGGFYSVFYGGFQKKLKSLGIWLGIVALLAIGYNYRGDIVKVVDRMFSVVTPDSDITASIPNSVRVARNTNGDFNVRAQVNGAPLAMLIDTGASSVVLTVEAARAAGLPVDLLKYDITIETAKGRSHAASVVLDQIRIGNIVERRVPALIVRQGDLRMSLLGMSFLQRLDSFELRGQQMVLRGRR
ncbi:MAG: TIGR02281 family clan AA aspartic protease [Xanthobacteraceae bacterium]|nr:TIGR02281 family clan AA aspartic protease [Xanthobacteraceae bacterium]MBX3535202.1 TIGR02281 family clan AA aspartic protease [Xanthobacteraceae bacterium]MCW5674175.1 TIGR02281 family clan AA aspartic protease [Xanthobacteraceae bacterium]MCW5678015.1 TIGR02281 family clan AA aspartic protease [Xanthobacteraceae bacterium]